MKNQTTEKQLVALKSSISIAIAAVSLAAYFAFGFFFDVFKEAVPILFLPLIIIPIIWRFGKSLSKIGVIIMTVILIILSVAASSAVGVIATAKPAYGKEPVSGSTSTYYYSKEFMKDNYNINQRTKVYVWVPDNYSTDNDYPVMYVLDGDMLFNYAALEASKSSKDGNGDMIVIGIGYGYWNSSFARGGIVYQDEKHLCGRWRDFCFADDTQAGYMPNTVFGGDSKRGKEYTDFIVNTVVKDVRAKYSVDNLNSTVFGHSLGGGLSAYFLTQYNPQRGEDNPFTNFVIVDNGYLDYYNAHYADLRARMAKNGNSAYSEINVYRIWGGEVNPSANAEQLELFTRINDENWAKVNNLFWIPDGANHSDTETIGIDNAIKLALKLPFEHQY